MRQVATFDDERTAKRFADVLCAKEIDTEVSRAREGAYIVWVLDERDVETSRASWAAFDANPDAPEHLAAQGCVERKQKLATVEERRSRHEVVNVRTSWRGQVGRATRVTFVLIAVSILVALVTGLGKRDDALVYLLIDVPDGGAPFGLVRHGQVWRLITPIFLHFGLLHIFFNMWWLLDLGSALEPRIGSPRFLSLVVSTAIISNVAQYIWTGSPMFGGMSGVLYALFGYAWVRQRVDPSFGLALPQSVIVILMICLVLGFSGAFGPAANGTHVAGLISGGLLGLVGGLLGRVAR